MSQLSMFAESLDKVVNVSKVRQLSPFRFPGGKTWLVPRIRLWLMSQPERVQSFFEPFVGGGIASLTVAAEDLAAHVTMVEKDEQIAAVWQTVFGRNWKWLADQVASFTLTYENAAEVIEQVPKSTRALAFQTLLKNRIYHGGILAEGSGMLKNGENGKGIHSRWYPETIRKRIYHISGFKRKITFVHCDGISTMERNLHTPDAVFFVDPPYTAGGKRAGKRLYRYYEVDHERIFQLASQMHADCLLTYDDAPEVRDLARRFGFETRLVAMQNTHHSKMKELLIGKDLSWLDKPIVKPGKPSACGGNLSV